MTEYEYPELVWRKVMGLPIAPQDMIFTFYEKPRFAKGQKNPKTRKGTRNSGYLGKIVGPDILVYETTFDKVVEAMKEYLKNDTSAAMTVIRLEVSSVNSMAKIEFDAENRYFKEPEFS